MASRTVHLITKSGPEWNTPIEAWTTKRPAEARAKELDELKSTINWEDRLSKYVVTAIPLKEQK